VGKTIVLLFIAIVAVTFGDIWMSQTMKGLGEIKISSPGDFFSLVGRLLTTPRFWLALSGMATFFFIWTSILSYADLTFVLPFTAMTYVLNAMLAPVMLNETVTPTRWAGVLLIAAGVALVGLSEAWQKTTPS